MGTGARWRVRDIAAAAAGPGFFVLSKTGPGLATIVAKDRDIELLTREVPWLRTGIGRFVFAFEACDVAAPGGWAVTLPPPTERKD